MPEVTIFGQVVEGDTYEEMASNFFEEALELQLVCRELPMKTWRLRAED